MRRIHISALRTKEGWVLLLLLLLSLFTDIVIMVYEPAHLAVAAAPNANCTLIVPPAPLSAAGLATPYQLVASNPQAGPCHEANAKQSAFVQAAVLDPQAGKIRIYEPLVVDQGSRPALPPLVPSLPPGAVVALWFGFNGTSLRLADTNGSLQQGTCTNGLDGSLFGQVAYCNAVDFFRQARAAEAAGLLAPPPLGTARDGMPCPSVRDFSVVDQDPSDNVTTTYLANASGQTAQFSAANVKALQGARVLANGSDNRLLSVFLDGALGCAPWMAPDLVDPGQMVPALALNELQAAAEQAAPVALVPKADEMVLVNGAPNLDKLNAYRRGVDQPTRASLPSLHTFCTHLRAIAPARMLTDARFTQGQPTPDPAAATSLLPFLASRFVFTYEGQGLGCMQVLGQPDPISVETDGNGAAISATINGTVVGGGPHLRPQGTDTPGAPPTVSPSPSPTTVTAQTSPMVPPRFAALARSAALAAGIPPDLFVRQIRQESGFDPKAVSPTGALGIAQFMPTTAACYTRDPQTGACVSVDPWDPVASLSAAARLMAQYVQQDGGSYAMALATYNAGGGALEQALERCGMNWLHCLPGETQHYIAIILGR